MEQCFAVCAPGLEPYAARELSQLGLSPGPLVNESSDDGGGIEFTASHLDIYRANLHLRTVSRVLIRLGEFYAAAFTELRKKAARLPWEKYLLPGGKVTIRVTCRKSKLYHSGAVAERIAGAIADHLGSAPVLVAAAEDSSAESQLIVVRLNHDLCTISIDSSGELLHRRGYRLAVAKAPLRETLAAGLLLASEWSPSAPLLDPFCGSGTIPIEAALISSHIAPGIHRRFSFMTWPGYDARSWNDLRAQAIAQRTRCQALIYASDRDAGAIAMSQANAERADVAEFIQFDCQAVSAITPPATKGWIVTNPPYGVRVSGNKDLRNLYDQIGNVLRLKCNGWQAAVLCSDETLLGHTKIKMDRSLRFINGGLNVIFGRGSV